MSRFLWFTVYYCNHVIITSVLVVSDRHPWIQALLCCCLLQVGEYWMYAKTLQWLLFTFILLFAYFS